MKKLFVLSLISLVTVFSGCASIIDPGPDFVPVNSHPEGATVMCNGEKVGETPMNVELDRSKSAVLTFEKDDYYPVSIYPAKVLNGWSIVGGPFMLVDLMFDNVNLYSSKPIIVTMTQK